MARSLELSNVKNLNQLNCLTFQKMLFGTFSLYFIHSAYWYRYTDIPNNDAEMYRAIHSLCAEVLDGWELDRLLPVLELARTWEIFSIEDLIIDKLEKLFPSGIIHEDCIEEIVLIHKYRLETFYIRAYTRLVERDDTLSVEECEKIGYSIALKLIGVRERYQRNRVKKCRNELSRIRRDILPVVEKGASVIHSTSSITKLSESLVNIECRIRKKSYMTNLRASILSDLRSTFHFQPLVSVSSQYLVCSCLLREISGSLRHSAVVTLLRGIGMSKILYQRSYFYILLYNMNNSAKYQIFSISCVWGIPYHM